MLVSCPVRAWGFQRGWLCLREQASQHPFGLLLLILFLQKQEKYYIIMCPVHNLFTESSIFPLAFFSVLGYYVLALKE